MLFLKGQSEAYDQVFRFQQKPQLLLPDRLDRARRHAYAHDTHRRNPVRAAAQRACRALFGESCIGRVTRMRIAVTGFDKVEPIEKLESELDAALSKLIRATLCALDRDLRGRVASALSISRSGRRNAADRETSPQEIAVRDCLDSARHRRERPGASQCVEAHRRRAIRISDRRHYARHIPGGRVRGPVIFADRRIGAE